MTGHYNRSCHVIMCNMSEMWGLIYSCAMRAMLTSCNVLLHGSDVMHASCSTCMHASQPPQYEHGVPEITYGHAICVS